VSSHLHRHNHTTTLPYCVCVCACNWCEFTPAQTQPHSHTVSVFVHAIGVSSHLHRQRYTPILCLCLCMQFAWVHTCTGKATLPYCVCVCACHWWCLDLCSSHNPSHFIRVWLQPQKQSNVLATLCLCVPLVTSGPVQLTQSSSLLTCLAAATEAKQRFSYFRGPPQRHVPSALDP